MNRIIAKKPEHETIYARIREMVLFGEVVPGQPLTIHGLAAAVGTGITPVREAIRRLTAEGALVALENRRIAVPLVSKAELADIAMIRMTVEPELAARGAAHAAPDHIAALENMDAEVDAAITTGDIPRYLRANHQFHFMLYDLAQSAILRDSAERLWLRIGPSLRVVCGRFGTSQLVDHHQAAIAALRAGDQAAVRQAIDADIRQGMTFVAESMDSA